MALILAGFGLIALIDLIPLIRRRTRRGMATFLMVFTMALTLAVLQDMGIEVPSVMHLWGDIVVALRLNY